MFPSQPLPEFTGYLLFQMNALVFN